MKIEIDTKSRRYENGFALYRTEYIDGNKLETTKEFEICDTQFQADLLNIGLALKYLINFDNQFGIIIKSDYEQIRTDKDFKKIRHKEKFRCYKESGEIVDTVIYTENVEVFENLYYSQRYYENVLIRKMLARVIELQKTSCIKISLAKEQAAIWEKQGVQKYG